MRLCELTENQSTEKQILQNYESLSAAEKAAFRELVTTRVPDLEKGKTKILGNDEFKWLGRQWVSKKTGMMATRKQGLQLSTSQTVTDRVAELYNTAKDQDLVKSLTNQFKLQKAGKQKQKDDELDDLINKLKKSGKLDQLQKFGDKAGDVAADLATELRKVTGGVAPAGKQKQKDDELDDLINKLKKSGKLDQLVQQLQDKKTKSEKK